MLSEKPPYECYLLELVRDAVADLVVRGGGGSVTVQLHVGPSTAGREPQITFGDVITTAKSRPWRQG